MEAGLRSLRSDLADAPEQLLHKAQLQACFQRCAERFAREQPMAAAVIRWVAEDDLDSALIAALLDRIAALLAADGIAAARYQRLGRASLDAGLPLSMPPALLAALQHEGLQSGADGVLRAEMDRAAP